MKVPLHHNQSSVTVKYRIHSVQGIADAPSNMGAVLRTEIKWTLSQDAIQTVDGQNDLITLLYLLSGKNPILNSRITIDRPVILYRQYLLICIKDNNICFDIFVRPWKQRAVSSSKFELELTMSNGEMWVLSCSGVYQPSSTTHCRYLSELDGGGFNTCV